MQQEHKAILEKAFNDIISTVHDEYTQDCYDAAEDALYGIKRILHYAEPSPQLDLIQDKLTEYFDLRRAFGEERDIDVREARLSMERLGL